VRCLLGLWIRICLGITWASCRISVRVGYVASCHGRDSTFPSGTRSPPRASLTSQHGKAAATPGTGSVGQQLAGVFEDHYTVAEQPPSLFRVEGHKAGRLVVKGIRRRTWRLVLTHDSYLRPLSTLTESFTGLLPLSAYAVEMLIRVPAVFGAGLETASTLCYSPAGYTQEPVLDLQSSPCNPWRYYSMAGVLCR
jgi:hypothetical protein